jgi:hypothetical protein
VISPGYGLFIFSFVKYFAFVSFRYIIHPTIKYRKFFFKTKESTMMQNVGGLDKIIRIIAGLILLALVFIGPKTAWGWLGLIPLATGLVNFCPLYALLKISTAGKKE